MNYHELNLPVELQINDGCGEYTITVESAEVSYLQRTSGNPRVEIEPGTVSTQSVATGLYDMLLIGDGSNKATIITSSDGLVLLQAWNTLIYNRVGIDLGDVARAEVR